VTVALNVAVPAGSTDVTLGDGDRDGRRRRHRPAPVPVFVVSAMLVAIT